MKAFAIILPTGRYAKSICTGTALWWSKRENAVRTNGYVYGSEGIVVPVELERDPYAFNGYKVKA